jgi:hypothetical protein
MLEMKVFLKKKEKCFITLDYLLKLIIKNLAIWKFLFKNLLYGGGVGVSG